MGKTRSFNNTLNEANIQAQKDGDLYTAITSIRNDVIALELYYDTNTYDLGVFEEEYRNFTSSWDLFVDKLNVAENEITADEAKELGDLLSQVKSDNLELINTIREKMKDK